MKITVRGKGGCGKSTVTSLLAKELASMGKNVLIVDLDESNYGLHRQLGVELPRDFTEFFGGKDKAFKTMMTSGILDSMKLDALAKKFFAKDFRLSDIPADFFAEKDVIKLLSAGKIHKANEGCACTMNSIIEQFICHLTMGPDDVILLDMEAGIEHFGRGTDKGVDAVLMVVEPSFESLRLSAKVAELCGSIQKPVYYCLNKITPENEQTMTDAVSKSGQILCKLPYSSELGLAGLTGQELTQRSPEIAQLARSLAA